MATSKFTTAELDIAARKSLTPYISHTYIADGSEQSISLLSNTPKKYILPVAAKEINGFGIFDPGGPNQSLQFQAEGETDVVFKLDASTSLTTSINNCNVKLLLYKNGSHVAGSIIKRKVGTGSDLGAMSIDSTFKASTGDLLEVYVESSSATDLTFIVTSIVILEV